MNRARYNKLAGEAYDRVADGADSFDLSEVIEEIAAELSAETANAELVREFATLLAHGVDDKRTKREYPIQLSLLTDEAALDQVWRLGTGRRVRAGRAKRGDALMWIGIRGDNAARVVAAYDKDRRDLAELLAFMTDDDMTLTDARRLWLASQ